MLAGHVFITQLLGLSQGTVKDFLGVGTDVLTAYRGAGHHGQLVQRLSRLGIQEVDAGPESGQHAHDDAVCVGQECLHQVGRFDPLMIARSSHLRGGLHDFLRLDRKLLKIHISLNRLMLPNRSRRNGSLVPKILYVASVPKAYQAFWPAILAAFRAVSRYLRGVEPSSSA